MSSESNHNTAPRIGKSWRKGRYSARSINPDGIEMHRCPICKENKPLNAENFQPNKSKRRFNSYCRPCALAKSRQQSNENRLNRAALQTQYQGETRTCSMCEQTYDLNPTNFKWQNSGANYSYKCRKCENITNRNRYKYIPSAVEPDARYGEVYKQTQCLWCGVTLSSDAHIDHIIPIARGGSSDPGNLAMACRDCNVQKKDMLPYEFIRFLRETGKL